LNINRKLNELQYDKLCKLTDELLLEHDINHTRIAINWLHVIREHPVLLSNYEHLFIKKRSKMAYFRMYLQPSLYKLHLLRVLIKSVFSRNGELWRKQIHELQVKEIIFISHFLNKSEINSQKDFYYSDLPLQLNKSGISVMLGLLNHTKNSTSYLVSKQNRDGICNVIFPETIDFQGEVKNIISLYKESKKLKTLARLENRGLKKSIMGVAANEALSPASLSAMRLGMQIKSLVAKTNPKILILTHEGFAWERMAFYFAKQEKPTIKCIGYTHAPIFKKQHSIKRCLGSDFNPDVILASGEVQKRQLENVTSLKTITKTTLGSNRCFSGNKTIGSKAFDKQNKTCLVVPEGIEGEMEVMFDFSLECAKKLQDINFIWRVHPSVSLKDFTERKKKYKIPPKNIHYSNDHLDDDLLKCDYVLYRGSSVVFQAVVAGLLPLYLHINDEMKIDPLFEIDDMKMEVETIQHFENAVKGPICNVKKRKAQDYCSKVFVPFDKKILEKLIS
jgi:hypothetical protein